MHQHCSVNAHLCWQRQHCWCAGPDKVVVIAGQTITTHSSFGRALVDLAWLPSSKGTLSKSCHLYSRASKDVCQLLQDHVLYLDANIKAADMMTFLGIRSTVTATSLLSVLREWSQQDSFTSSLLHMTSIYERLSQEMADDAVTACEVCAAFESHPMIWLPLKESSGAASATGLDAHGQDEWELHQFSRSKEVQGKFYGISDKLFFRDVTCVLESTTASPMRALFKYYPSNPLHSFFLEQLQYQPSDNGYSAAMLHATPWGCQSPFAPGFQPIVPSYPSTADYCELLASLASQPTASTASCEQALQVLLHWAGLIERQYMLPEDAELLKAALYSRALLPTMGQKWAAVMEGVYILDDEELAAAFEEQSVHFLWLPESMKPSASR